MDQPVSSAAERPFRVLGVQQLAVGGLDKARLRQLWCGLLGLTRTGEFRSERENVDEDICALGSGATAVEVDLMQPLDPDKKPAVHATPLNHDALVKELGDCLWYIAAFATVLDLNLDDIAQRNIDKLRARYPEGFDPERSRNRTD